VIAGVASVRRIGSVWRAAMLLVVLGSLAACGGGEETEKAGDPKLADLKATAQKANKLSDLQQAAYTRNTLLRFSAAEQDYRETLGLARELFPLDPAKASSLRLHLALNKSNLGQYEAAEELFQRARPVVKEIGTVSERAKPAWALSTWAGCGTPISTSTCLSSLDLPSAVATVSELCHSASRRARTAALV